MMFLYMIIASLVAVVLIIVALFLISSVRNTANNSYFSSLDWQNFNDSLYKQNTFHINDDGPVDYSNSAITSYCPNCGNFTTDIRAVFCVKCGSTL